LHAAPAGQQPSPHGAVATSSHTTGASARFVRHTPLLQVEPLGQQLPSQHLPLVRLLVQAEQVVGATSQVKPAVQAPAAGQQPPSPQVL
jgi:hypothetical protein